MIKDYENIFGMGIIGALGIMAMYLGIQPEVIAVAALSALAGYIGGKKQGENGLA
jgi:hypothetical protein